MSLNRATLRQLRALAATIRSGSVTAAAQELNVTPPAVSLQLKLLEELAGIALLERAETGMRATGAGRELADTALHEPFLHAVAAQARDLRADIGDLIGRGFGLPRDGAQRLGDRPKAFIIEMRFKIARAQFAPPPRAKPAQGKPVPHDAPLWAVRPAPQQRIRTAYACTMYERSMRSAGRPSPNDI